MNKNEIYSCILRYPSFTDKKIQYPRKLYLKFINQETGPVIIIELLFGSWYERKRHQTIDQDLSLFKINVISEKLNLKHKGP